MTVSKKKKTSYNKVFKTHIGSYLAVTPDIIIKKLIENTF